VQGCQIEAYCALSLLLDGGDLLVINRLLIAAIAVQASFLFLFRLFTGDLLFPVTKRVQKRALFVCDLTDLVFTN